MPDPEEQDKALLLRQRAGSAPPEQQESKPFAGPLSLLRTWQSLKNQDGAQASTQSSVDPTIVTGPTHIHGPTIVTGTRPDRQMTGRQTFEELVPSHQSLIPYPELPSIPSSMPAGSHAHLTEIRDTAFASGAASSFAALPQMPSQPVISKDHDLENHQPTYDPLSHSPLKRSSPRAVARPRPQDGMASHYVPASLSPPSHRICSSLAATILGPGESNTSLEPSSPTGRPTVTTTARPHAFSRLSRDEPWHTGIPDDSQPLLVESPRVSHAGAPWLHYQVPLVSQAEQSSGYGQGSYANDITLGVINFVIALPITIAFARITYSHPVFAKLQPELSRLLIAANATHAFVGAMLSRLPFTVAQVQDLGLIFLNAMTSDIAVRLKGEPQEVIVGTAIVACSLATMFLGVVLIVVGRKKLTGIVAYIPQPVVAGYLGYVGYFCLAAGVAQGTGLPIHDPWSWTLLLTRTDAYFKELATLMCYGAILFSIKVVRSQAGLPMVLMLIPILWYALQGGACLVLGMGWGDLQDWLSENGWVSAVAGGGHKPFWKVYELFNLVPFSWSNISWISVVRQAPTAIALALVCSFGTPMDIVAIQAQVDYEIDSDYEASTIGYANLAAGLFAGGGTGSYIFSQCLLALNGGTTSRAGGLTIGSLQLLTFLLPVSLVHLLPNFYYGGLLVLIGTEIIHSWLFLTYWRITKSDVVQLLQCGLVLVSVATSLALPLPNLEIVLQCPTSACISQGLEAGLLVGVVLCALHFAYEYSLIQLVSLTVLPSRSHAMLPFRYQQVLALFQHHITAVSVSGYIFFGSMVEISRRLRAIADNLQFTRGPEDSALSPALGGPALEALGPLAADAVCTARTAARRFLLLDLRRVTGIDATTATSFASLSRALSNRGVTMVLTGLRRQEAVQRMLVMHNVVATDGAWEGTASCPAFESMDEAIMWCEHHFKEVAMMNGLMDDPLLQNLTLTDVLRMHIDPPLLSAISSTGGSVEGTAARLGSYMKRALHRKGTVLFDVGDASDTLYILLSGGVASVFDLVSLNGSEPQLQEPPAIHSSIAPTEAAAGAAAASCDGASPRPTAELLPHDDHVTGKGADTSSNGVDCLVSMNMHSMHMQSTRSAGSIPGYCDQSQGPSAPESRAGGAHSTATAAPSRGRVQIVEAGPGAVIGGLDYTLSRKRSFQCLVTADATVMHLSRSAQQRMAHSDSSALAALQQMLLRSSLVTTAQALAMFENSRL